MPVEKSYEGPACSLLAGVETGYWPGTLIIKYCPAPKQGSIPYSGVLQVANSIGMGVHSITISLGRTWTAS